MPTRSSGKHVPFTAAVALAAAAAFVAALKAGVPNDGPPAAALGSEIVFRFYVGAIVFCALYAVIVLIRLAYHGKTLSKVSATGAEIPDIADLRESVDEYRKLDSAIEEMQARVAEVAENLDHRVSQLEAAGKGGSSA